MKRISPYRPDSPPASAVNAGMNPALPGTGAAGNGDNSTAEQNHRHAAALEAGQTDPMPFPGPFAYDLPVVVPDQPGRAGATAHTNFTSAEGSSTATTPSSRADAPANSAMSEVPRSQHPGQASLPEGRDANAEGLPPLPCTAKLGDLDKLRRLLARPGLDVNEVGARSGETALFLAAEAGRPDMVKLLLAGRANVNFRNRLSGTTALMRASFLGKLDAVDALLTSPDILINQTDNGGSTALIWASSRGHAAVVERLLRAGANPAWRDSYGKSALFRAVTYRHFHVVECLLGPGTPCPGPLLCLPPTDEHFVCLSDLYLERTMPAPSTDNPLGLSDPSLLDDFDRFGSILGHHLWTYEFKGGNPQLASILASQGLRNIVTGPLARFLGPYDDVMQVLTAVEEVDSRTNLNSCQRQAYFASALSRLATLASDEQITATYKNAGLSEAGVTRLSQLAIAQRNKLVALAEVAAAEQASKMLNKIVANCRAETRFDLGADVNAIKEKLIDAGFIPPLANILANSWHAAVGELARRRAKIPQMGSIAEMTAFIGKSIEDDGPPLYAREIRRQLDSPELLAQWRIALGDLQAERLGGLFALFEDQCRQLREYCVQMEKTPDE